MTVILVPYHLDEHLPGLRALLPADVQPTTVNADIRDGDVWSRLGDVGVPTAQAVAETAHGRPVIVSGDCSTSMAVLAGLQRTGIDAGIVWFDAHGDVQTVETSASGYPGGMPLRIITGYRPELIAERLGLKAIAEDRALLVGARDLDPPETAYLGEAKIRQSKVEDVAEHLPPGPLVLHIDVDVIDSDQMPGLRYPVGCGPSVEDVVAAAGRVLATGRVAAVDIACTWFDEAPEWTRASLLSALLAEAAWR